MTTPKECVFCEALANGSRVILATFHFFAVFDRYPVNRGHMLIIPKRHHRDIFSMEAGEWLELAPTIYKVRAYLDKEFYPKGYNIGINCGEAAGQTVMHSHIHVIPRYDGDVENPRGGIRNFKPPLVKY